MRNSEARPAHHKPVTNVVMSVRSGMLVLAKRSEDRNAGKYALPGGFVAVGGDDGLATGTREVAE